MGGGRWARGGRRSWGPHHEPLGQWLRDHTPASFTALEAGSSGPRCQQVSASPRLGRTHFLAQNSVPSGWEGWGSSGRGPEGHEPLMGAPPHDLIASRGPRGPTASPWELGLNAHMSGGRGPRQSVHADAACHVPRGCPRLLVALGSDPVGGRPSPPRAPARPPRAGGAPSGTETRLPGTCGVGFHRLRP